MRQEKRTALKGLGVMVEAWNKSTLNNVSMSSSGNGSVGKKIGWPGLKVSFMEIRMISPFQEMFDINGIIGKNAQTSFSKM